MSLNGRWKVDSMPPTQPLTGGKAKDTAGDISKVVSDIVDWFLKDDKGPI